MGEQFRTLQNSTMKDNRAESLIARGVARREEKRKRGNASTPIIQKTRNLQT